MGFPLSAVAGSEGCRGADGALLLRGGTVAGDRGRERRGVCLPDGSAALPCTAQGERRARARELVGHSRRSSAGRGEGEGERKKTRQKRKGRGSLPPAVRSMSS